MVTNVGLSGEGHNGGTRLGGHWQAKDLPCVDLVMISQTSLLLGLSKHARYVYAQYRSTQVPDLFILTRAAAFSADASHA